MNEKTPIASTDPFRRCRIAAVALSLLTATLVCAVAMDLARRPTLSERRAAIVRMLPALVPPVTGMTAARTDIRYGPLVPAAVLAAGDAVGIRSWEDRQ